MLLSTKWTEENLSEYRLQGDIEVDELVAKVLPKAGSEAIGTFGYNEMLLLSDQLINTPELALIKGSKLSEHLKTIPDDLVQYFEPMEAPDWVDQTKLQAGSKLWKQNTLMSLGVLYSSSLPACYLMKNGISALYKSEKLRDKQYVFQRIYETGIMLATTMDPGGISILEDAEYDDDKLLLAALKNLDAESGWSQKGPCCKKTKDKGESQLDPQDVHDEVERLRDKSKRYLWGKGYINAKKVRFLHAAMRYMLIQENQCCPFNGKPNSFTDALSQDERPWDFAKFGHPINQEDLAYTLLTFGMLIPRGLKRWGIPVSKQEQEGFLHLWKVIGHTMGIRSELLTDNWEEAEQLYALIQKRQAGHSKAGVVLTESLMGFLNDYLPRFPGFSERLSTALIVNQLGMEQASKIISEKNMKTTFTFWRRPIYKIVGQSFKVFLHLRGIYYRRYKHLGWITANRIHEAAEQLIQSWRSAYLRKPFFVPVNTTQWIRKPGVDQKFISKLRSWRRRLLNTIVLSLGLLSVSVFSLSVAFPLWLFDGESAVTTCLSIALVSWISFFVLMNNWLPVIFSKRPLIGPEK